MPFLVKSPLSRSCSENFPLAFPSDQLWTMNVPCKRLASPLGSWVLYGTAAHREPLTKAGSTRTQLLLRSISNQISPENVVFISM